MRPHTQTSRLSESAEDYLEVIGTLCQKHGQAQVSDIALALNVKKPSVTAAIRQLAELELIEYRSYAPIKLTEKGRLYAEKVMHTHQLLCNFFHKHVGFDEERATMIACHMEHVLNDDEVQIFEQFKAKLSPTENKTDSPE